MVTISKLRDMPYAQAHIKHTPNRITLVSYTTEVATIIGDVLVVHGLYSTTTRRHISAFVREYCGCEYTVAKKCYIEKLGYDIVLQEYVPLI